MLSACKLSPHLTLVPKGRSAFVSREHPDPEDVRLALEAFALAQKALEDKQYSLVILDEINVAIDYGLIPLSDLLQLLDRKPKDVELVLTGRHAKREVLERADLVTEMMERKHYHSQGLEAREGIEY